MLRSDTATTTRLSGLFEGYGLVAFKLHTLTHRGLNFIVPVVCTRGEAMSDVALPFSASASSSLESAICEFLKFGICNIVVNFR